MKTHFIDIIGEVKSIRSSRKIKIFVALFFEYNRNNKRIETEMFIYSIFETIMQQTDSGVFVDDIIKSTVNKCNDIDST